MSRTSGEQCKLLKRLAGQCFTKGGLVPRGWEALPGLRVSAVALGFPQHPGTFQVESSSFDFSIKQLRMDFEVK